MKSKIILPPEVDPEIRNADNSTERTKERKREDEEYIPVIIKRMDEVIRHPDDTLDHAIKEGLEQFERPSFSIFVSAVVGGLIIGLVAMLVGFADLLVIDSSPAVKRLVAAIFYPFGFIVCIMSGAKLYTEQTATAIYPILEKKTRLPHLLKIWGYVLLGNLVGTFFTSNLLIYADEAIQLRGSYETIALHLTSLSPESVFISAVLAGWLMAQGSWLILSTSTASGQIICIYIVTFMIGIGGLTHSIAGSAELFVALLSSDSVSWVKAMITLGMAIIGNSLGGAFFVGFLNYAHIRKTQS